MSYNVIEGPW